MTTAKVRYRNYIPYGHTAIKFCDVKFYGDNDKQLQKGWSSIKYEKYEKCKLEFDRIREEYDTLLKKENKKINEINENKHWWKFWSNKTDKELKRQLVCIRKNKGILESNMKSVENDMYFSCLELVKKAENYLTSNDFVLKNCSCSDTINCDIWESI